jgi:hypothetical protein
MTQAISGAFKGGELGKNNHQISNWSKVNHKQLKVKKITPTI